MLDLPSPVPEHTPLILPEPGQPERPAPKLALWARARAALSNLSLFKKKSDYVVKG